jgi:hypothetical protein
MSPEQDLLTKWRSLPKEKQEEVLDFVEFLHVTLKPQPVTTRPNKPPLGERLRQIRAQIVDSGEPLLTQ